MKNTKTTEIACYVGYVTQAIVLNLLPLFFVIFQNDYGISSTKLSLLIFLSFFVQIGIDLLVASLGDKVNLRFLAVLSHAMSASGLILLAVLPGIIDPFVGIIIAAITYSVGSALLEVVINPLFDRLPQKESKGFTFAHSFYCWGQMGVILISALALKLLGSNWRPIPLAWAIIPLLNMLTLCFAPIPEKAPQTSGTSEKDTHFGLFKGFFLFIIVMICAGASEQGVAQWASYFAEKGLGTSKLLGDLLGPCMFAFFMAMGRMLFSIFGQKLNIAKALTVCALSSTVCYLAIAFVPSPVFSLAACALSGLTVSIMWPAILDLASGAFYCTTAAFSFLSVAGDIGCTLGPAVNGIVSDIFSGTRTAEKLSGLLGVSAEQTAIRLGFALDTIFPLVMIFVLLHISKKIIPKSSGISQDLSDGK